MSNRIDKLILTLLFVQGHVLAADGHEHEKVNYLLFLAIALLLAGCLLLYRVKRVHPASKSSSSFSRLAKVLVGTYAMGGACWILALVVNSVVGISLEHYFLWIVGAGMLLSLPVIYRFMD